MVFFYIWKEGARIVLHTMGKNWKKIVAWLLLALLARMYYLLSKNKALFASKENIDQVENDKNI